ncbi:hypothetical protein [Burkholderia sola]|uniref:hypothetical protein n=1 Tax=Burkholderia sola TaxID=2843302 RepID=UPI0023DD9456|nr:hypothetical protein [Burkholderia sola]MDF3084484.1 hypothetical protein [Burkholderia sola]
MIAAHAIPDAMRADLTKRRMRAATHRPRISRKLSLTTPPTRNKIVRMPTFKLIAIAIHCSVNIRKNGSREALVR